MSARPFAKGVECSLSLAPRGNLQDVTNALSSVLVSGMAVFEVLADELAIEDRQESNAFYGGLHLLRQAHDLAALAGELAGNTAENPKHQQVGAA